jgi:hypothetical protein
MTRREATDEMSCNFSALPLSHPTLGPNAERRGLSSPTQTPPATLCSHATAFATSTVVDMAATAPKQYGMTNPLSSALPTEAENQATNSLIEELRRQNNYESASDTNKRYIAPAPLPKERLINMSCTQAPHPFTEDVANSLSIQNDCPPVTSIHRRRVCETSQQSSRPA